MKSKSILYANLIVMGILILCSIFYTEQVKEFFNQPEYYASTKFVHVLAASLFFANAVIGTIWETRSFLTGDLSLIRYTYKTVVWLDAVFTAPLITIVIVSGITLSTIIGGVWSIGWLSHAVLLFFFSGFIWCTLDIPTQYSINRHFRAPMKDKDQLTPHLARLLKLRLVISLFGTLPLLVVLFLMTYKPNMEHVAFFQDTTLEAQKDNDENEFES